MFFRKINGKSSFTKLLPILLLKPNWKRKYKELEKNQNKLFEALKSSSSSRPSPYQEGKGRFRGEEFARASSKWGPSFFFGWSFIKILQVLLFIAIGVGLLYSAGYLYLKYKAGALTDTEVSVTNLFGPKFTAFQRIWGVLTFDETVINKDFGFKDPTKQENVVKKGVKIVADANKQDFVLGEPISMLYTLKADQTENPYNVVVKCKIQDSNGWHDGKTSFQGRSLNDEGMAFFEIPLGSETFETYFSCDFPASLTSSLQLNTEALTTLKVKIEAFYDYSTTTCVSLYSVTEENYAQIRDDDFYQLKIAEGKVPRCVDGCGLTLLSLNIINPWVVPSSSDSIFNGRYAVKGLLKQDENWEGSILEVKDAKMSLPSTAVIERGTCDGIMDSSLLPQINSGLKKSFEENKKTDPLGFICNFIIRKASSENIQYGDLCSKVQYTYATSILDTLKIRKQSLFAQSDAELYKKMQKNLDTMIENKQGLFSEP
ncbi:MAG TPA: hypothetical protein VJB94_02930 [Candidatus Nanoarchaeia archaeon]|nr:hypothetical protein [Candidatus Nanoarchaeia archaeon]